MKIKRFIVLVIILVFVLSAVGCGKSGGVEAPESSEEPISGSAAIIKGLSSDVNAGNKGDYDFTEKALAYLEYIGTELPVRDCVDEYSDHDNARNWIVSELKKAGYSDDQIEEQVFGNGIVDGVNIILTVEGEDPSYRIIAGAHYDGDGVGDNGSGTALLLANAVGLFGVKPHFTVEYIFFDCEEVGCVGSNYHAKNMTNEEAEHTLYMINLDSLAFGDYCNIYGGDPSLALTEGYELAADVSESLGFKVMRTADLDGYFAEHGDGPDIEEGTLYTNPWTHDNPPPTNFKAASPATLPASDHVGYMNRGIEYIYFEATNWFAQYDNFKEPGLSFTGYVETSDSSLGDHGMFMNTEYDNWDELNRDFPGRAEQHYRIYSPLLSALILVR